jgi:Icc-related predicted phosphoesterase
MREVKIVAFSDIHGYLPENLPEGDIALIAGDICPVHGSHSPTSQHHWLQNKFIPWCYELINSKKFKHICFCGGNHDFVFKSMITNSTQFYITWPDNVHYLLDQDIDVMGVSIYGTPWTPTFGNWAFMGDYGTLERHFKKIPEKIDIVLSHGPMYGYNDTIMQYPERTDDRDSHLGSKALLHRIKEIKCSWCIHGHIHSGNHNVEKCFHTLGDLTNYTNCVNVSRLDENYDITYPPFIFSIFKED